MLLQLGEIFFNVITPVFALVLIGYIAAPRLGLEARTLSRFAYYILVPAFVFNVMSTATVEAALATQMLVYILLVHLACALLGYGVARLLRRPPAMVGAYVLVAVFGNVGNFGLPLIEFRLGEAALIPATVYFLAIIIVAFVIGVAAANLQKGGSLGAILAVFKTPALLALPPALLVNWLNLTPPLLLTRITGLLGGAMVPTMLVALGVQLAATHALTIDRDVVVASGLRLLGGAALALLIVVPFGLTGLERGAGVLQSAMPTAVLASIIALEYDLLPDFVTTAVLFSTLASVITLTLLMAVL
ncbi:MAG: AEC family transporter [Ardenticatenaceae bacterium]|nr:AEC family transporter [Ardenticatenaceae bacterium]